MSNFALKDVLIVNNSPFWLLIGGPPCQAYSLAGRSRMKNEKSFAGDHQHTLYRIYPPRFKATFFE